MLLSGQRPLLVDQSALESQMSKRKPATASKHTHAKIAAKAQLAAQAVVRSPKNSVGDAASTELFLKRGKDSQRDGFFVEDPDLVEDPELPVEKPETALQDHSKQMPDDDLRKETNVPLATASVPAYQAKLMEMAQANVQFSFEFAQRLAAARSPVEFTGVIAEFTSKRIAIFGKHSIELAELSTPRWTF
jgi:hypothetical protein